MDKVGKALLQQELVARKRAANERLGIVTANVLVASTAIDLWTELNETEELGAATAAQFVAHKEQGELEALISRLERGIELLQR